MRVLPRMKRSFAQLRRAAYCTQDEEILCAAQEARRKFYLMNGSSNYKFAKWFDKICEAMRL
ncbi:MAG: hypothetical protein ACPGWR_25145 [Ardenticatenaceae bacterium]